MIKSVTVVNHLGDTLVMELKRPRISGFYIRSIEGLGPVQANINVVDNAILDGASYSSSRVSYRNIVMNLGFVFANGIEDVRHESYKYFPPKRSVKILIETDKRICETCGYVEYNSPDIFNKEVTTQISIICPNPFFYDSGANANSVVEISGMESSFEFPFSNESLEDDMIVLGEFKHGEEKTFYYLGDVEVGMSITIHAAGPASNITIHNVNTDERMVINTTRLKSMLNTEYEIIAGDDIVISTIRGEKSITLIRGGKTYNIINCLDRYPDWFQLSVGANTFVCKASEGEANLKFKMEYGTVYEGV